VASIVCPPLGRGVTRSKRLAMAWRRKAAELGFAESCLYLATAMYLDIPYAREVGHVGEAAGVAASVGVMEGHDVSPDVLTDVVRWLRRARLDARSLNLIELDIVGELDRLRRLALEGGKYCFNEGCEVVGHWKIFKVCPQCKTAMYCGDACQKQDWTTGGHKAKCGTFESKVHNEVGRGT